MSWKMSRRDEILSYMREVMRVDAKQVSTRFGITYFAARYHLEKLVEGLMIERGVDEVKGMRHVYYVYLVHRGISLTWNVKTKPKKGEGPMLDITLTTQTVIAMEEEERHISVMHRLAELWLQEKFGGGQATGMNFLMPRREREVRACASVKTNIPEYAVDYWTPTIEQINKYANVYAFYWCWERNGRSGACEGERKKVPYPEDIPADCASDPTKWSRAIVGRKRKPEEML